ncbi:MAG: heavy metal-associated domain-containing protein [Vicinamibacterales bacterium]
MRAVTIVMSLMLVIASPLALSAQDKVADAAKVCVVEIEKMECSSCAASVQKALMKTEGVTAATVNQPTGSAAVTYDSSKTNPETIAKSITKKTGFSAKPRADRK